MKFEPKIEVKYPNLFSEKAESLQNGLLEFLNKTVDPNKKPDLSFLEKLSFKKLWEDLSLSYKGIPLEQVFEYLKETTKITQAMSIEMRESIIAFAKIKRLAKQSLSTPKDLSRLYRQVREQITYKYEDGVEKPLFFGEMINELVNKVYKVQEPYKTSLVSQLMYISCLCSVLFEELGDKENMVEEVLSIVSDPKPKGNTDRYKYILRMLRRDFFILSAQKIILDYCKQGLEYSGIEKEKGIKEIFRLRGTKNIIKSNATNKHPKAFHDIPVLRALRKFRRKDTENLIKEFSTNGRMVSMFLLYIEFFIDRVALDLELSEVVFYKDNVYSIQNEIEDVKWEEIRFGREVPAGAQRTYFPENRVPLIFTVDPSPSKTYLAVVSLTAKEEFISLLEEVGSHANALETVSPLRKPFSPVLASRSVGSFCFMVHKDSGELYTYGDSNSLVHAQLGEHYDNFKKIAHDALMNLTHVDYIPKIEGQKNLQLDTIPVPKEMNFIPNKPVERATEREKTEPINTENSFLSRRAHSRVLPKGWFMSIISYENAKKSGQLDLWSMKEGNNEEGVTTLTYLEKLDLSKSYQELLKQKDEILKKHGGSIRFQTYVSQTGEESEENFT